MQQMMSNFKQLNVINVAHPNRKFQLKILMMRIFDVESKFDKKFVEDSAFNCKNEIERYLCEPIEDRKIQTLISWHVCVTLQLLTPLIEPIIT